MLIELRTLGVTLLLRAFVNLADPNWLYQLSCCRKLR